MRKTFLAVSAAAVSIAVCSAFLAVATPAGPSALQDRADAAAKVATIMCGSGGCAPVQTKQQSRRKFQTMGHG
jgi:hypothetical protein